jgi:uroporphyrinogen-III synthase
MAVLVTRPYPDGKELCEQLSELGLENIYQPLIEFSEGEDCYLLADKLNQSDIVIAVSKPAVEWANRALHFTMQTWPVSSCYLAVGQITADKLSEVTGQKVHYPDVSDSEHLLGLPALLNIKNKKVMILRGNGGRELIRDMLLKRGAIVEYCEVYQRQPRSFDGHSSVRQWKKEGVTQIVLTSGEQLEYFFSRVPKSDYQWLINQQLIVPSNRIADLAKQLGFNQVMVSGSASNPDLVAAIKQQCTTGQVHDK